MEKIRPEARRISWYWVITLYAATVSAVAGALILHRSYAQSAEPLSFLRALLWQSAIYFLWASFVPVILYVGKRFRLRRGRWAAPLPAYLALSLPVIFTNAVFNVYMTWLMSPRTGLNSSARTGFTEVFGPLIIERLSIDMLIYWAIVGLLYAGEYYNRYSERERRAAELEAELARAQLQALRMQLDPHFLFNALQALSVLIKKEPEAATRMALRLGDLLRKTLSRGTAQEVTLREELSLVQDYLAVEQARFSDRLRVDYQIEDAALRCMVPDFILQPVVENALKHGLSPRTGPGRVGIKARLKGSHLVLEVEDDGVGLHEDWSGEASDGIGLMSIRSRLQRLYGEAQSLYVLRNEAGGVTVRIELEAATPTPTSTREGA